MSRKVALLLFLALLFLLTVAGRPSIASVSVPTEGAGPARITSWGLSTPTSQPIVQSDEFLYVAPPSISRDMYIAIYEANRSTAMSEAGAIYDFLVGEGMDPAVHAAQASHETSLGTAGIGAPAYKNMHGVQCHAGDNRISDSPVPWGNGCAGVYASYLDAVKTWARLIKREYVAEGLTTPDKAVWKYAPVGKDGNNPPRYIADMHNKVIRWRSGQI